MSVLPSPTSSTTYFFIEFLREGQSISDFPLPYMPEHHDILKYLQEKALLIRDPTTIAAVEKVSGLVHSIRNGLNSTLQESIAEVLF